MTKIPLEKEKKQVKCERIYLADDKSSWFDTYIHEQSKELLPGKKRPAVLVCPGGGYQYTSDREAEPMAIAFASMGYHAFVLRYGVDMNAVLPRPLKETAAAVAYIKDNTDEWLVDENAVFLSGFSAGGHLAASLGVFWNDKEMLPEYADDQERIRPAGLILGYPVIDLKSTCTKLDIGIEGYPEYDQIGFGSWHPAIRGEDIFVRENNRTYVNFEVAMNAYMFGGYATDEQIEKYSLQKHVTKDSAPAFIWHGGEDGLIFPRNSMLFANALMENNVPCELHIFGSGGHGLGLANEVTSNYTWEDVPECRPWLELANTWIKSILRRQ